MDNTRQQKVDALTKRALSHGVDLKGGLAMEIVVERLLDRMDLYRADQYKGKNINGGRILVE